MKNIYIRIHTDLDLSLHVYLQLDLYFLMKRRSSTAKVGAGLARWGVCRSSRSSLSSFRDGLTIRNPELEKGVKPHKEWAGAKP